MRHGLSAFVEGKNTMPRSAAISNTYLPAQAMDAVVGLEEYRRAPMRRNT
jgi:hypothetical protein